MKFKVSWLTVVGLLLLASSIYAQDLAGEWQGTLQAGNRPARIIITFRPADNGGWTGALYSIDQGFDRGVRQPLVSIARQAEQLQFIVDGGGGAFEGRIGDETIEGTWTQQGPRRSARQARRSGWTPIERTPADWSRRTVAVDHHWHFRRTRARDAA
jgi:hypothetical protein